jgi:hypothetical protein
VPPEIQVSLLVSLWLAMQSTPAEVQAFRDTAPDYLTPWSASQHLGAARVAADRYGVDYPTLLAIAHHESRFVVRSRTREPSDAGGPRVSCGVMTPVPKRSCADQELTVLGGYLAGASHLRTWMDACHASDRWRHDVHDREILRCALWAYAGGRGFRAFCQAHEGRAGCDAVGRFEQMAQVIRRVLGAAR